MRGNTLGRTLMDRSVPGRGGVRLPDLDVPVQPLPDESLLRGDLPLPELAEPDVVRYFTHLSQANFSIDTNFYPLGSCTMKYNPKVNDELASIPGFASAICSRSAHRNSVQSQTLCPLVRWIIRHLSYRSCAA